jgi:hypothetical protein
MRCLRVGKVKPASQGSDGPKPQYAGPHGAQTVALVTDGMAHPVEQTGRTGQRTAADRGRDHDGLGLSHFQHTSGRISA